LSSDFLFPLSTILLNFSTAQRLNPLGRPDRL
jgi:hypothetical protein